MTGSSDPQWDLARRQTSSSKYKRSDTVIHVRTHTRSSLNCRLIYANFSFSAQVVIDKHPVRFFVHKRPHVDFFLEVVSVGEAGKAHCVLWNIIARVTFYPVCLCRHSPLYCTLTLPEVINLYLFWIMILRDLLWLVCLILPCALYCLCVHRWASGMSWWFLQPVWRSTAQQWQTSWTTTGTSWNADTTDRYCSTICV